MTRIYGKKAPLKADAVHAFFEGRGQRVNAEHPITSVLYQDHDPDLAMRRDQHEKATVLPLLELHPQARVLDVGCGIGRWAHALAPLVAHYHGVDFSSALIEQARQYCSSLPGCSFQVLAAQSLRAAKLEAPAPYSHILLAGVLLYLNDEDVTRTLRGMAECAGPDTLLYIREPMALQERLTLDEFASAELGSAYSAIYRTRQELMDEIQTVLIEQAGFRLERFEPLYPDALNNRAETRQQLLILRRA